MALSVFQFQIGSARGHLDESRSALSANIRKAARGTLTLTLERQIIRQQLDRKVAPMLKPNYRSGILAFALLAVVGCVSVGPKTIPRDQFDYAEALRDSWKEQMLLNMVGLRYAEAPLFLKVTSVINQYSIDGKITASAHDHLHTDDRRRFYAQRHDADPAGDHHVADPGRLAGRPPAAARGSLGQRYRVGRDHRYAQ
jgi:hypothetical protein